MVRILIATAFVFALIHIVAFADSTSENLIESSETKIDSLEFHQEFREAFSEAVESAANDFEDVVSDSERVKIGNDFYNKVMLDFPNSSYAYYHKSQSNDKQVYSIKIHYDAKSKDKVEEFLENTAYYDLYEQLLYEFQSIQKIQLGGNWHLSVNNKELKMHLKNDPALKVYVKPSGKTGFEIEFNLSKLMKNFQK